MIRILLFFAILVSVQSRLKAQAAVSDTLDLDLVVFSLPTDNIKNGFYKVSTKEEYLRFQNNFNTAKGDTPFHYDYPQINFRKYILLGGVFQMNSCDKVTRDERLFELKSQRKVVYKLNLVQYGQCADSVLIKHWILVKKKRGYTYQFNNQIVEMKATKQ